MSRRKSRNGRNGRNGFAEGDEDFLDFFYFFDERSGKADDCGTIKYYAHEIIIVTQKGQKGQKELRRVRVT